MLPRGGFKLKMKMLWFHFRNWMIVEKARQVKGAQVPVNLDVIRELVEKAVLLLG